ncbi:MAG: molybdopterin molybdotransferase MoeA [Bacteroidetes bacterium]|nr:molybdopterin molybdotransferase MoeA [Bacteroidota bacterium]
MITVNEAKKIIAENIELSAVGRIPLHKANGLVLAADVKSAICVPPFDNSAMDGFAFKHDANNTGFIVSQNIKAGDYSYAALPDGEAARIFTGAPIPEGADTVIQQEFIKINGNRIEFDKSLAHRGINVRLKGAQCAAGEVIAKSGCVVTPGLIGLLVSAGIVEAPVYLPPTVAIIATGSELRPPGTPLKPGEIYNSNSPAIQAYLEQIGIKNISEFYADDDLNLLKEKTAFCLEHFDVLILSGGISAGEYDHVQNALVDSGVPTLFYKVKQKPGKPLLVGKKNKKWIFALPGNPAAALVCFNQYIKPCIKGMTGENNIFIPDYRLPVANGFKKKKSLTYFLKAKMISNEAVILSGQDSFNLLPFNEADCFAEAEEGTECLEPGTTVNIYSW